jgi:hypothetical protein
LSCSSGTYDLRRKNNAAPAQMSGSAQLLLTARRCDEGDGGDVQPDDAGRLSARHSA